MTSSGVNNIALEQSLASRQSLAIAYNLCGWAATENVMVDGGTSGALQMCLCPDARVQRWAVSTV
jgi:hypothetical protein